MLGNVAVSTAESGAFLSIEQVLVARAAPGRDLSSVERLQPPRRRRLGAGCAAVAVLPGGEGHAERERLATNSSSGSSRSRAASRPSPTRAAGDPRRAPAAGDQRFPSRRLVHRIAALFALDSFAGGFALQILLAYWLDAHFGLSPAAIGTVFFAVQLLTAISVLPRSAPRTVRAGEHDGVLPPRSNALLIGMGLAPTAGLAVALLLLRALLSQMDVPTRQAFLMLVVRDDEREATATVTNAGRTVAQAVSPALTGYVMQAVSLSAPFVLGGGLKIVYDLLLYQTCRRVAPVSARERAG